ncbi:hypothetical protein L3X38_024995 [Prunus dulcis]|uniref:Uncharacterized protein n=1 Tax=Prunus dulcis TaxID=3755 RepID=A0AAD4W3J6_PRUDU|nr:hypothetical protein L3X38_024995 [Prunus dulcis]
MYSLATTKEIQSLTGRAAALNQFLSRSTDKCRPFFRALKKRQKDKWDEKCDVTFQNLKTDLTSPHLLSKLVPKTHNQKMERLILSLEVSARKLRPYYQAH